MHGLANIVLGTALLLWANLSAENVLNRYLPPELWPSMFIAAGICGLIGLRSKVTARFAFVFAAIVTGVFGFASLYAVVFQGALSAVPATVFLLYTTYLKIYISWVISQRDKIMHTISEATRKGQSALDTACNGTNT